MTPADGQTDGTSALLRVHFIFEPAPRSPRNVLPLMCSSYEGTSRAPFPLPPLPAGAKGRIRLKRPEHYEKALERGLFFCASD